MILGLTGFSGAGKSTVAAILAEHGFYHLDCDRLVHQQVYRDPLVLDALEQAFSGVVREGKLDRGALRAKTMGDPAALQLLDRTVMPHILAHIEQTLAAHAHQPIILDAPLLFESGLNTRCDCVLSVITDRETALKRIIERDGLTPADAQKRLASQHPASYYTAQSDYIINNDKGVQQLRQATLEILNKII